MSELALPFESRYYPHEKLLEVYRNSIEETEAFWEEEARQLDWFKAWDSNVKKMLVKEAVN